jgi:hypothetical protein
LGKEPLQVVGTTKNSPPSVSISENERTVSFHIATEATREISTSLNRYYRLSVRMTVKHFTYYRY